MEAVYSGQAEVENEVMEAFARSLHKQKDENFSHTLQADWLETPVGSLLAAGDNDHVYLLSFAQKSTMARKAAMIQRKLNARVEMGRNATIRSIAGEVQAYFAGKREAFETPLKLIGTAFQILVWEHLQKVAYGHTITYTELARKIVKPAAFRAVAQACAQNPVSIAVPCHRLVNDDGAPGTVTIDGDRKRWLVEFEQRVLAGGVLKDEDGQR